MKNGELIEQAEAAGYDVLLSTDKNIRYQQNLTGRKIALVILGNPQWPRVQLYLDPDSGCHKCLYSRQLY